MQDREYLTTHPWMTFDVRRQLDHAPRQLWQLLGGVTSLANVLADTPLMPEVASEMHMVYLAKGALATTAIEGNTLTEEEVRKAILSELKLPPSKEYLETEIMNMVTAFNDVMSDGAAGSPGALTSSRICEMNRQVLKNLELEPGVVPGEVSSHGVVVGGYRGAPRRDCEYLLDRLCEWLESDIGQDSENPMEDAVIKALLAHLYLAWIHAFGDGNGRTARLVEFFILFRSGVPAPAAHLLSNHFNDTRNAYYRALALSSQTGGDVMPFLIYALQGFRDGLDGQLDLLRNQTEELVWQSLVHEAIPGSGVPAHRRRRLAIALFHERRIVARSELEVLTRDLARLYKDCSSKTLTRDMHTLEDANLISRAGRNAYQARVDRILGMTASKAPGL